MQCGHLQRFDTCYLSCAYCRHTGESIYDQKPPNGPTPKQFDTKGFSIDAGTIDHATVYI